jgi:protein RecA
MSRTKFKEEKPGKLSAQMARRICNIKRDAFLKETGMLKEKEYEGDTSNMISTGSTLLDLAISGGRVKGGGLPGGILVEIFGPSGSGKTVLLCEIAGSVQRKQGDIMFHDPEARLNQQFARLFDLNMEEASYSKPNTVTEVFQGVRKWEPKTKAKIHGIFTDSLAALSTNIEMEKEEGDKMGMRRAKELSEELRKTCRILTDKNYLMVCSNQVRINVDGGQYAPKYVTPGGEAVGFYSSLRLRTFKPELIKSKIKVANKEVTRIIGVTTLIEVFKSSIWKPYRIAPVTILFDYGIDDVRENLQFVKDYTKNTVYTLNGENLSNSMEEAIHIVEAEGLTRKLKQETIMLWEEIEKKFKTVRKPKMR